MTNKDTNQINEPISEKRINRRSILIAGVVLLTSLGSVYSWSFFTAPLREHFMWSNMQISFVFSLAVAGLGFVALYTGPLVSKLGSRRLMKRSSIFFVSGYLVAALGLFLGSGVIGSIETPWVSWLSFSILALGYGVIGGIGLGTGYVTAVTTVAGWFPDKKGFATGVVVMGFGLGAIFMSKVFAPLSMQITSGNVTQTFLIIAAVYAVIMSISCRYIYSPQFAPKSILKVTVAETFNHVTKTRLKLWMICFLYSFAGLGIISILAPLMQDLMLSKDPFISAARLTTAGATLIAAASIGNSVGRLFWAWLSDFMGRVLTFAVLLGTAALAFLFMPHITSPLLFGILISYVIASYGGAFGTIPSLISDMFGPKRMSAVHGLILSGWATAGLIAPPLFGHMSDIIPDKAAEYAYYICAGVLVVSTLITISLNALHKKCIVEVEDCKDL